MKTKSEATIEDLYNIGGKAEIVDGDIVHMSPTGKLPGYAGDAILVSLFQYARKVKGGVVVGDNKGFIVDLPHRKTFSPNAAFHIDDEALDMKFYKGAPLFAVEVRSENDYGPAADRQITAKRADYFAAGTQVVWDVDLLSDEVVRVYRASQPAEPTIYRRGDLAEAEPALPGWTMPVDDLFPLEQV